MAKQIEDWKPTSHDEVEEAVVLYVDACREFGREPDQERIRRMYREGDAQVAAKPEEREYRITNYNDELIDHVRGTSAIAAVRSAQYAYPGRTVGQPVVAHLGDRIVFSDPNCVDFRGRGELG